jgi:hypothetical protein
MHLLVNCIERGHIKQLTPYARLIGCHHRDNPPDSGGRSLAASRDRHPFIRRLDEGIGIMIDDAITVEIMSFIGKSLDVILKQRV